MNLDFLGKDTFKRGLLLLRILTVGFLTYSVLLSSQVTLSFLHTFFLNPIFPIPFVIGETYAALIFALLFGVRRTFVVVVVLLLMATWDLRDLFPDVGLIHVITYMPQTKVLIAGIFISLLFSNLSSHYEHKQHDLEMRERNKRIAMIKGLHDGAAKKITQALIHVRTNPSPDPEVINFLDQALSELRETMTATEGLYDTRDETEAEMPTITTCTLPTLLSEYETLVHDRNLRIECVPDIDAFPPLPECISELINNAVKYANIGSTITLTLTDQDKSYGIRIENDKPPSTDTQIGSHIGLESTSRAFIRLGAQFTTFDDGDHFTATVTLPKRLTEGPSPQPKPPVHLNIFSRQSA
ncbi:hypothetical protein [Stomatohabitans albus]|uniref:hypothetical protein n=1 Tax=Stomatohabitans albus TaxID=3110766 RepID=UPI00300D65A1